jgi:hypothetical protein
MLDVVTVKTQKIAVLESLRVSSVQMRTQLERPQTTPFIQQHGFTSKSVYSFPNSIVNTLSRGHSLSLRQTYILMPHSDIGLNKKNVSIEPPW